MEEVKLDVFLRNELGKKNVRRLRRQNFFPAIVYGGEQEPTIVQVNRKIFEGIRRVHYGEGVIFHINVLEGERKLLDCSAIVKEEQHHPVTNDILHVDFKRISLTEEIEIKVEVKAKGEPIGVKKDGGALDHLIWELDIRCLPTQIPHHIEIDVSHLKIGDSIHVRDLVLPEGVKTDHDPDSIVFVVAPPMKEEVEREGPQSIEPEVLREKKEEKPAKAEGAPEKKEEKKEEKKT